MDTVSQGPRPPDTAGHDALPQTLADCHAELEASRRFLLEARAERHQFASIFDSSRDAVWTWSLEGEVLRWNAEAERLFGYRAAEIVGRPLTQLIPEERRKAASEVIAKLREGAWYGQYETVRLRKDGSAVAVELTVSPLFGEGGEVVGAATVCRDITERRQAEEALARRMKELGALYALTDKLQRAGSFDAIFDAALDAITSALGCSRASILLFDDSRTMRFVAWRGLSEGYRKAVDGHSPWDASTVNPEPIWIRDIAGSDAPEALKAVVVAEDIRALGFIPLAVDGRLIGKFMTYYDAAHDFTADETGLAVNIARQLAFSLGRQRAEDARRSAERSLRESERRLELAMEVGRMGAWEWNVRTGKVVWSPGLEKIHGIGPGQFTGRFEDFSREIHPGDLPNVMAEIQRAVETGGDYHVAYRLTHGSGPARWMEAFGRVVPGPDGKTEALAGICMDITERKRAEERQHLLINELNHRVKNTLATVQAIAAQTLRGGQADPAIQAAFESRLIALSNAHGLLTKENWAGADIHQIVAQGLEAHASPGRFSVGGPPIFLPPKSAVAIAMGIHELATNAAKYGALSDGAGLVSVSWSVSGSDEPILTLEWKEQGGPRVTAPTRRGFGSRLIERSLCQDLDGHAALNFDPRGLVCTITTPIGQAATVLTGAVS